MHDVLKALPAVAAHLNDERAFEPVIAALWRSMVGEDLARVSRPGTLHNKVLSVAVQGGHWKPHVRALSREIIYKINLAFAMSVVLRLKFEVLE